MAREPWNEEWSDEDRERWLYESPRRGRRYFGPEDEGFERRGWREGSDYYGRRPSRYVSGDDEFDVGYGLRERATTEWESESPERSPRETGTYATDEWRRWRAAVERYGGWGGLASAVGMRPNEDRRGRGPRGYQRSDERIREEICELLTDDPWIDASDVEVSVAEHEVTLSGEVHTRAEKRLAEDLIDLVPGVSEVHNRLRVTERRGGAAP